MNRAGQPPQRPPSLGPNPALGGPFRAPFPQYGIPPRNVMPGYPALPNHRTTQNVVPQPSPNYIQQRGQSGFPFVGGIQQQQQSQQASSQHTSQTPLAHQQQQQSQSQQGTAAVTTPGLPPHLAQNSAPSLGTAPSVSSASEVGLDPNDFPALGSTPTSITTPSTTNATSYASQAGTGAGVVGNGTTGGQSGQRDFTADDFPALGGTAQASQHQPPAANSESHPPGLNGFQQQNTEQHRQSLLGSLAGNGQQQPGVLNLGQARSPVNFQSETEKRNYALKLNNQSNLTWTSPNANPSQQQANAFLPSQNGTRPNHAQSTQQPSGQPQQQQHIPAPPGVPPPASFSQQPQAPQQPQAQTPGVPQHTPYIGNGTVAGDTPIHPSQSSVQVSGTAVPQTPAQQVLMSPADRWGLLGLLAMIKSADLDINLLSVGTDLGTMGLDMQAPGSLYSTFITPWADSSAAHTVEPDFHLPACYNVAPPPPGPAKAAAFSDETLFFMFYASPRDALQEIAAQELWNRNWRYHKELRLWITKETGTPSSAKIPGGEQGTYSYWDPDNWEKARKDMTVLYSDLEEKSTPVFAPGQTLQLAQPTATQTPQHQPQAMVASGRVGFQGLGVAAM
ncbi:NOT2 family protein [Phanerochaete sordida]|uniref:NOT2 family protein n=1 Tax=Phanerochaete sordida TaxID=48140 RepID=A0A9P3GMC7_9APHY|nr:NOT2 family protein [Phanerochaete sordida]